MFTSLALLGLLASPADAAVYVHVGVPAVQVVVDPWSPAFAPAPRAGWVWVSGWFDARGAFHPGHWQPAYRRAGFDWVPGYWVGARYVDGYWRPAHRAGYTWVAGYYSHGAWCEGYWVDPHRGRWYEDARADAARAHHAHVVAERHDDARTHDHDGRHDDHVSTADADGGRQGRHDRDDDASSDDRGGHDRDGHDRDGRDRDGRDRDGRSSASSDDRGGQDDRDDGRRDGGTRHGRNR